MNTEEQESEFLTVNQAREELGISRPTIARLIREGFLHAEVDPLNRRVKLIRRSEVKALQARSLNVKKALARAA